MARFWKPHIVGEWVQSLCHGCCLQPPVIVCCASFFSYAPQSWLTCFIIVSDQQNHRFYTTNPLVHPSTARIPAWWPASVRRPEGSSFEMCGKTTYVWLMHLVHDPRRRFLEMDDRVQSRLFKTTSKTCRTRWATSDTIFGSPLVDEARPCACSRSLINKLIELK